MAVEVRFKDAEVLKVGPGECLIITIEADDWEDEERQALAAALNELGLEGRCLVMENVRDSTSFAVVEK